MQAAFKRRPGDANIAICVGCVVFTALSWWSKSDSGSSIPDLNALQCTADNVYGGKVWALFTAVFFHGGALHIFFNLSFLWRVGNALEEKVGSARYVAFVVMAAVVSNAMQLSFKGPAIGISGVVCAIFGFMWQSRNYYEDFYIEASDKAVKFVLAILVLMIPLDYLFEDFNIAHYAHFAGLGFGMAVGRATTPRHAGKDRLSGWVSLVIILGLTIMSVVYAPWSKTWLTEKGKQAINNGDYGVADKWLTRAAWLDKDDDYVLYLRTFNKLKKGEIEEGKRLFLELNRRAPHYAKRLPAAAILFYESQNKSDTDDDDEQPRTPGAGE